MPFDEDCRNRSSPSAVEKKATLVRMVDTDAGFSPGPLDRDVTAVGGTAGTRCARSEVDGPGETITPCLLEPPVSKAAGMATADAASRAAVAAMIRRRFRSCRLRRLVACNRRSTSV